MRLLLFNPETEYALASGASFYTPPASVCRLRLDMQLLPEDWALPGDFILVEDTPFLSSRFGIVSWTGLQDFFMKFPDAEIEPWGWNQALIRRLSDAGVPKCKVPDEPTMHRIRSLAHRRTTILLNTRWNEMVEDGFRTDVPCELLSVGDCMEFCHHNAGCWFKAPWSSSGRGVINTAADMTEEQIRQWCHGIIRRQGSVMGETGANRVADYASEWRMVKGEALFLGLSSFSTSDRGKYISNHSISQDEMKSCFSALSNVGIEYVISIQKRILEEVLSGYEGPCGVDMLIERSGALRPFVELNLRRTMGMRSIPC